MNPHRFLISTAWILSIPLGIAPVLLYRFGGWPVVIAVLGGSLLAAAGALIWLGCLLRSRGSPHRVFLGFLVGGILTRLVLFGAGTLTAILSEAVHLASFVMSLFLFFVVFQVLEIRVAREVIGDPDLGGSVSGRQGSP